MRRAEGAGGSRPGPVSACGQARSVGATASVGMVPRTRWQQVSPQSSQASGQQASSLGALVAGPDSGQVPGLSGAGVTQHSDPEGPAYDAAADPGTSTQGVSMETRSTTMARYRVMVGVVRIIDASSRNLHSLYQKAPHPGARWP